LSPAQCN